MKYGLTTTQINKIKTVFNKFPEIEKVLIYGSRAKGNYRPSSDIDLSLFGNNIDLSLLLKIEMDLDDLLLPYKFDLSIYDKIKNPEFVDHIDRVGIEFFRLRTYQK